MAKKQSIKKVRLVALLLSFTTLISSAQAATLVFNLQPTQNDWSIFLLSNDDGTCGSENIKASTYKCTVQPGTYKLSVYPPDNSSYGAIIDRPFTVTSSGNVNIKLPTQTEHWDQFTYKVKSTCPVDVTYADGSNTRQESKVDDGWDESVERGSFAYLSAQLTCTGGTVTAYIILGGSVIKQATSRGDYSIAQVSYP